MSQNLINQVLLNQFRIDEFIASGGEGEVYKVWDFKRNVPLAMKVLRSEMADDPSLFKRFKRQARALEKLAHPNIVPFYGIHNDHDLYFILQGFINGPSLKEILREKKVLPISEVLVYMKALCAALGYAHVNGVVHCDVKPGNVMIDKGGNIYLIDFGIVRHAESTTTTLAAAGTAAYMAPEQVRGEPVTPATDIYALGVMLFEMMTGQRPFRGNEPGTETAGATANERIRYAQVHLPPPDPRNLSPAIAPELSQDILRALAKSPGERFGSTQDFLAAVLQAAGVDYESIPDRVQIPDTISKTVATSVSTGEVKEPSGEEFISKKFLRSNLGWIMTSILGSLIILTVLFMKNPATQKMQVAQASATQQVFLNQVIQSPTLEVTPTSSPSTPTATATPTPTPTITLTAIPSHTPLNIRVAKDGAELVYIPPGEFIMGSEKSYDPYFWGAEGPPHRVFLDGFWIFRTEVTNAMYQACVAEKACPKPAQFYSRTRDSYYDNPDYATYPVIYVSYRDALAYCGWVGGRLPTEAEWEKAARGTDERLFPWGNDLPSNNKANLCDRFCPIDLRETSIDDGYRDTAPVGSFPAGASPYGVLDMAGNVSEWTADWMGELYYSVSPEKNPLGPASGLRRVLRGGSWSNPIEGIRTVGRFSLKPLETRDTIGFRCVIDNPSP